MQHYTHEANWLGIVAVHMLILLGSHAQAHAPLLSHSNQGPGRASPAAMLQDTLVRGLQTKEKLRDDIKQQLEKQTTSFDRVEKDAQALLQKALHANRKITVQHAQHQQTAAPRIQSVHAHKGQHCVVQCIHAHSTYSTIVSFCVMSATTQGSSKPCIKLCR